MDFNSGFAMPGIPEDIGPDRDEAVMTDSLGKNGQARPNRPLQEGPKSACGKLRQLPAGYHWIKQQSSARIAGTAAVKRSAGQPELWRQPQELWRKLVAIYQR